MDTTDFSAKKRVVSYADALRGYKVFSPKPKPKPAQDQQVEAAPVPKEELRSTKNARKTSQKEGLTAAQKKRFKVTSDGVKPSHPNGTEATQCRQSAKNAQLKPPEFRSREHAGQPATRQVSYADAVKGASMLLRVRHKKAGPSHEMNPEAPCFNDIATVRRVLEESASVNAGSAQEDHVHGGNAIRDCRWVKTEGVVRHSAASELTHNTQDSAVSRYNAAGPRNMTLAPDTARTRRGNPLCGGGSGALHNQRSPRSSTWDHSSPAMQNSLAGLSPSASRNARHSASSTFSTTSDKILTTTSRHQILPARSDDHLIRDTTQQATSSEDKMNNQRENRIHELIEAHDRGEISLWEDAREWDVMVICGSRTWQLHREILARESQWFGDRLPAMPVDADHVVFDCAGHCPAQLWLVLYWMYNHTFYNYPIFLRSAFNGRQIHSAAFMYICGASVACESMMLTALGALGEAAFRLQQFFEQTPDETIEALDLSELYYPITAALEMTYEQPLTSEMLFPLRLAMAVIVEVVNEPLGLNPEFVEHAKDEWEGERSSFADAAAADLERFEENRILDGALALIQQRVEEREGEEGELEDEGLEDLVEERMDEEVDDGEGVWEDHNELGVFARGIAFWSESESSRHGSRYRSGPRSASGSSGSNSRSSSGSAPGPRNRNQQEIETEDADEEEDSFDIWEDAEPDEEAIPTHWLRNRGVLDDDDIAMFGQVMSREERWEVRKENNTGLRRPIRPSGPPPRGYFDRLVNFTDHPIPAPPATAPAPPTVPVHPNAANLAAGAVSVRWTARVIDHVGLLSVRQFH
ncbi:hypothetical protein N657DRAFT_47946 [Parathielavia appendiculata]|uniref:BTB domain-containing protein n=1 Tax=Parathielavia appendiculata TaxID=2587402 RepID=A0AAN6U9J0_9PEZI|nr:hypothetical protein N657DRAFT_47946 [Parathielavia appendiculata]